MSEAGKTWPPRWDAPPLDQRTIEFIARLNEQERRNLIMIGDMSDKDIARFKAFLELPAETWDAGIRLAQRSASWTRLTKRFPSLVLGLAALLGASNVIWNFIKPWVQAFLSGNRP